MNTGLRYAALRLRTLAEDDRTWILARLPVTEANALRALMHDPNVARLSHVAAQIDAPVAMPAMPIGTPVAATPDLGHLDDESAPWAAAWLRVREGDVAKRYLGAAMPAHARRVSAALDGLPREWPPRLREALLRWSGEAPGHP